MKESPLYPYYIVYLENKVISNEIKNNTKSMLLISGYHFSEFCLRMSNDIYFKEKINKDYLVYNRNIKIEDILYD
jgi:hypothetical protein